MHVVHTCLYIYDVWIYLLFIEKNNFFQNKKQTKEWNKLWTRFKTEMGCKGASQWDFTCALTSVVAEQKTQRMTLGAERERRDPPVCWINEELYQNTQWPKEMVFVTKHRNLHCNCKMTTLLCCNAPSVEFKPGRESWQIKYRNVSIGICWQIMGVWREGGPTVCFSSTTLTLFNTVYVSAVIMSCFVSSYNKQTPYIC